MLNWLRNLFSPNALSESERARSDAMPSVPDSEFVPMPLSCLRVEPDDGEDFDAEACRRLIDVIAKSGATTIDDINNVVVSIEEFFDGNRTKYSIAANVEPPVPYDTAQSWADHLKIIRSTNGVHDVLIEISMIEPYEDGRVGMWPYADPVWVYSSLDQKTVSELVSPLDPDEVRDASLKDPGWDLIPPPVAAPAGVRPYWVWWD